MRPSIRLWPFLLLILSAGCLPRDPERTLERVHERGTLRVGLVAPGAEEVEALRSFAAELGVSLEEHRGSTESLMQELEHFQLDVLAAALTPKNPWKTRVGFSRPWPEGSSAAHVFACPPGENAFVMRLDRFLHRRDASR